jgi:type I restriction enzyme S subunit
MPSRTLSSPAAHRATALASGSIDVLPDRLNLGSGQLGAVLALLQRYLPGLEVRAFGSRTTGTAKPASDLDLLVMSAAPLEPMICALLADGFAESDLPFEVDVVDASLATPSFRAQAVAQSVIVQLAGHSKP